MFHVEHLGSATKAKVKMVNKKTAKKTRTKGRQALGRGLSALISSEPVAIKESAQDNIQVDPGFRVKKATKVEQKTDSPKQKSLASYVAISSLVKNPKQPRKEFSSAEIKELSESISKVGLIQPILVRPKKDSGSKETFEIVAGERRYRAAKLADLKQVPVIIKDLSDIEVLEVSIIENIQRENLSPIEEAQAFSRLVDEFALSHQQIAERVSKSRTYVSNSLRLLGLPEEVLASLKAAKISVGHAKAILTVKEPQAQINLAKKCIQEKLSVRALEEIVGRIVVLRPDKKVRKKKAQKDSNSAYPEICDRLRNILGTKVLIKHSDTGSGKIEINYYSEAELDRLIEILGGNYVAKPTRT